MMNPDLEMGNQKSCHTTEMEWGKPWVKHDGTGMTGQENTTILDRHQSHNQSARPARYPAEVQCIEQGTYP